jgi:hypothetical protein
MVKTYHYTIKGSGAGGQTWTTKGVVEADFVYAFDLAMRDSFQQLTQGQAVYGKPGRGCSGPYDIHSITIEQMRH